MTTLAEKRSERLWESLYEAEIANGLRVFILPKKDFRQTYATFTTKYGSLDSEFLNPESGKRVKVPDGIAHFLEHKMFEEEDGDVFNRFAQYGAQTNAFTTFDSTTYLFSSTSLVEENLTVLLDFVQNPYFTDQNVEKEKGIIAQEIKMYEDTSNWRSYFGLLKGFYGTHPAATDIAGTVDSIAKITKEDLYQCYRTFYHPSNMMLFIIGPVDPQAILTLIENNQAAKTFTNKRSVERFYPEWPSRAVQPMTESQLAIAQPRVLFGYKDVFTSPDPKQRNRQDAAMELWMDAILGRGSKLFHELIEEGLTDQGFTVEYELTERYGHSILGGNSLRPLELVTRAQDALQKIAKVGIDQADFLRVKRKAIGRFVSLFDSPQGMAHVFTAQKLRGIDIFETLSVLEDIELDDVNRTMQEHLREDQFAVSLVRQLHGEEAVASESTN